MSDKAEFRITEGRIVGTYCICLEGLKSDVCDTFPLWFLFNVNVWKMANKKFEHVEAAMVR
jgi:hypothetical protein